MNEVPLDSRTSAIAHFSSLIATGVCGASSLHELVLEKKRKLGSSAGVGSDCNQWRDLHDLIAIDLVVDGNTWGDIITESFERRVASVAEPGGGLRGNMMLHSVHDSKAASGHLWRRKCRRQRAVRASYDTWI